MNTPSLLSISEAADLKNVSYGTLVHAIRVGQLVAWRTRPTLLDRADVLAWVPRAQGRQPGCTSPPSARTRRMGGSHLHKTLSAVAEMFNVTKQAVHQARRRIADYDAKQAGKGETNKSEKSEK